MLITINSPHERCGVGVYGRALDKSLSRLVASLRPVSLDRLEALTPIKPGDVAIIHFEPGLLPPAFASQLTNLRRLGLKTIFSAHHFGGQYLTPLAALYDVVAAHRAPTEHIPGRVEVVPLGCPVFEAGGASWEESRRRLNVPADATLITTIGFLTRWKKLPETMAALLRRLPPNVYVQLQTPWPFNTVGAAEEEALLRQTINGNPHVRWNTAFIDETELLERVACSDFGFLFHGQHTGSVSAATKSFVSARCPVVLTDSNHDADMTQGVWRVGGFDPNIFADRVLGVLADRGDVVCKRAEMSAEYARLNMDAVARHYIDIAKSLGLQED